MKFIKFFINTPKRIQFGKGNILFQNFKHSAIATLQCQRCLFCTSLTNDKTRIHMIASRVLELNTKYDVMAACIPVRNVSELLQNIFGLGFSERAAVNLLTRSLWSIKQPQLIVTMLDILKSYNLTPDTMIKIFENLPSEFKEEQQPLQDLTHIFASNLEGLTKLGFSDDNLDSILSCNPKILFKSFKDCLTIMSKLNGLIDASVKVTDLIIRCPNVLTDDWDEITQKFDYAYFNMGYEVEDITNSSVFSHTFDHIRDRHIYLVRTGFFIKVKRKDDEKMPNPNPPLKSVLDSSDRQFAKMFGNMSKEEYNVYLQMRKLEKENEESDKSDDETS